MSKYDARQTPRPELLSARGSTKSKEASSDFHTSTFELRTSTFELRPSYFLLSYMAAKFFSIRKPTS